MECPAEVLPWAGRSKYEDPLSMPATELTRAQAQAIQGRAEAGHAWLMWFVAAAGADFPGKIVAWAVAADCHGGTREPGSLVADTIEELRAKLPSGLTRRDRTAVMSSAIIETWD